MKILCINCFIVFLIFDIIAVNPRIDSLENLLKDKMHDTVKIGIMNKLFGEFIVSDFQKALITAQKTNKLAVSINHEKGIAASLNNIGYAYYLLGEKDSALVYYLKAIDFCKKYENYKVLAIAYSNLGNLYSNERNYIKTIENYEKAIAAAQNIKDSTRVATLWGNIGNLYYYQGSYAKALDYYIRAQKIREKLGDKKGIANVLCNIGNIYDSQDNYNKALEYYKEALLIMEQLKNRRGISGILSNIGEIYFSRNEYEKALEYFSGALDTAKRAKEYDIVATALNNIGRIYEASSKFDEAYNYYFKTLKIQDSIGYITGTVSTWNSIGNIYKKNGDYRHALEYFEKSLEIAKQLNMKDMIKLNYDYISLCYSESGDFKNAFYYKNQSSMINDSIYSEESLRQIADMQIKYETEKKEKEIELLTRDMQVKNLKLTRNKILIAFISTGFILVLIIASVLYNRFRLKKRANVLLLHQKNEIEQQKKAITDSINYARRIQQAVMPNISNLSGFETLSGLNLESFILFKPRDVVSGDFYWISVKKSRLVVAAADCTGHGVPGAFMSMLGIAFLNEIVTNTDNLIASHILDKLRECVVKALHQSGKIGEAKDGMDMTLCIIAPAEKKLQFAGAYNPLYLIPHPLTPPLERQHTHPSPSREGEKGGVLLEIKADRMPIGISLKAEKPFTNNELSYNTGDTIYLFTDGFADQFGGKYGKKFTYHSFKKLLSDIYQNDMAEQHKILNATFEQWKAGLDQIDDVLIIGIRL